MEQDIGHKSDPHRGMNLVIDEEQKTMNKDTKSEWETKVDKAIELRNYDCALKLLKDQKRVSGGAIEHHDSRLKRFKYKIRVLEEQKKALKEESDRLQNLLDIGKLDPEWHACLCKYCNID